MLQGEHSAILSTFIKLPFVIRTFVLSIFEWPFYTGFIVQWNLACLISDNSKFLVKLKSIWDTHESHQRVVSKCVPKIIIIRFLINLQVQSITQIADNGKCSKISNTLFFLFSNKILFSGLEFTKLLVRIGNREDPDQTASL